MLLKKCINITWNIKTFAFFVTFHNVKLLIVYLQDIDGELFKRYIYIYFLC